MDVLLVMAEIEYILVGFIEIKIIWFLIYGYG